MGPSHSLSQPIDLKGIGYDLCCSYRSTDPQEILPGTLDDVFVLTPTWLVWKRSSRSCSTVHDFANGYFWAHVFCFFLFSSVRFPLGAVSPMSVNV